MGVHRTKRSPGDVRALGTRLDVLAALAHAAEGSREAAPRPFGGFATDLQVFEAVGIAANAHSQVATRRIDVALPKVGGLENVTVGIDRAGVSKRTRRLLHRREAKPEGRFDIN